MDSEPRIPRSLRLPTRSLAASTYVSFWATRRWLASELGPTHIDPLCALLLRAMSRSGGGAVMGTLGELFSLPPSTVATAIARLERRQLATRSHAGADGRVVVAELTELGRGVAKQVTVAIDAIERQSERAAGPDVRAGFNAMTNLLAAVETEMNPWD